MSGVELGLAIVATADLCLKYGKILIETCRSFRHADSEVSERVIRVESAWIKTTQQLNLLRRIWSRLDESLQNSQNQTLQVLVGKLRSVLSMLEKVHKKHHASTDDSFAEVNAWKYAALKSSLDRTINDLEEWQKVFDPSWFLIMLKIDEPAIDQQLASEDKPTGSVLSHAWSLRDSLKEKPEEDHPVFLPEKDQLDALRETIQYSTAIVMQRLKGTSKYIVDSIPTYGAPTDSQAGAVRALGRKLSTADPLTYGLMACRGIMKKKGTNAESNNIVSFDFVFKIPTGMDQPRSLRELLIIADASQSLSDRFNIARQMTRSVVFVHAYKFVHKGIRPETVLVFRHENKQMGASFLLGFEHFRGAKGNTLHQGDSVWEKNLYRHPRRQGTHPTDYFVMQHDIYSLGMCLLEIGLWRSFVEYPKGNGDPTPSAVLKDWDTSETNEVKRAFAARDILIEIARKQLPSRMGDRYTSIVINCLTCLDKDNEDFGDASDFQDADGISIGVRYVEKILSALNDISL